MGRLLEFVDSQSERAQEIWCDLEEVARPSYFLTWGWIDHAAASGRVRGWKHDWKHALPQGLT